MDEYTIWKNKKIEIKKKNEIIRIKKRYLYKKALEELKKLHTVEFYLIYNQMLIEKKIKPSSVELSMVKEIK